MTQNTRTLGVTSKFSLYLSCNENLRRNALRFASYPLTTGRLCSQLKCYLKAVNKEITKLPAL